MVYIVAKIDVVYMPFLLEMALTEGFKICTSSLRTELQEPVITYVQRRTIVHFLSPYIAISGIYMRHEYKQQFASMKSVQYTV